MPYLESPLTQAGRRAPRTEVRKWLPRHRTRGFQPPPLSVDRENTACFVITKISYILPRKTRLSTEIFAYTRTFFFADIRPLPESTNDPQRFGRPYSPEPLRVSVFNAPNSFSQRSRLRMYSHTYTQSSVEKAWGKLSEKRICAEAGKSSSASQRRNCTVRPGMNSMA